MIKICNGSPGDSGSLEHQSHSKLHVFNVIGIGKSICLIYCGLSCNVVKRQETVISPLTTTMNLMSITDYVQTLN